MLKLIEFNDHWKDCYVREKRKLLATLKGQKISNIEHIGATSVVMCQTCGTIDVLCSIPNKIEFTTIKNILVANGYQYLASMSSDDCLVLARRNNNKRIVSLVRVVEHASKTHKEHILFKYYLREKESHVKIYNDFRKTLLLQCGGDAKEYQKVKKNYIESILHDFCKVD